MTQKIQDEFRKTGIWQYLNARRTLRPWQVAAVFAAGFVLGFIVGI